MEQVHNRWLHRFAVLTAAATFYLLVVGSMVTSTDSGDAVPDWWFIPISLRFDTLLPPLVAGVLYEQGHRLVATAVGILTVALAFWVHFAEKRSRVVFLGWLAAAGVVLQGVLGGLRVLLGPQSASALSSLAIVHACVGQAFFCLIVSIALFTSRWWMKEREEATETSMLPSLASATTTALCVQLLLGAIVRHTGYGVDLHICVGAVAGLLGLTSFAVCARRIRVPGVFVIGLLLLLLLAVQLSLGIGTYHVLGSGFKRSITADKAHLYVINAHLGVGALVLACSLVQTLVTRRMFPKAAGEPSLSPS